VDGRVFFFVAVVVAFCLFFVNTYPMDSDLSVGEHCSAFEQPVPVHNCTQIRCKPIRSRFHCSDMPRLSRTLTDLNGFDIVSLGRICVRQISNCTFYDTLRGHIYLARLVPPWVFWLDDVMPEYQRKIKTAQPMDADRSIASFHNV